MAIRGNIPWCSHCTVHMDSDFNMIHKDDCKRATGFSDKLLIQPEWGKDTVINRFKNSTPKDKDESKS